MISTLFHFILLVFIVTVVIIGAAAISILRSFNGIAKKAKEHSQERNRYRAWGHSTRSDNKEETIIDRRTPDEANRKIFTKDEGEYVDFEEEK